jgi:enoyl-CoA hydratase/carnithine racemase
MSNTKTTPSDILLSIKDKIGLLTINRPEKLNAIRLQTYGDIISALKTAEDSPECSCIVITGTGGKFTAGNDLTDLAGDKAEKVMEAVQSLFNTVTAMKKPLIAAVEGVAVGIGTTFLLHCDLAVASENTRFRLPFANLGVCPEGGSSALLPRAAGAKAANELLLTGRFFSAEEALKFGLINRITPNGSSLSDAMEYAEAIAKQPLPSILATKSILRKNQALDMTKVVSDELKLFLKLALSTETQSRIKQFTR